MVPFGIDPLNETGWAAWRAPSGGAARLPTTKVTIVCLAPAVLPAAGGGESDGAGASAMECKVRLLRAGHQRQREAMIDSVRLSIGFPYHINLGPGAGGSYLLAAGPRLM